MINFIIPGAQKSATTFMHNCMKEHPSIYMPADEISYFESPDYELGGKHNIYKEFDIKWNDKIVGIKRPNYLAKKEVPTRIYKYNSKMKFIVVLRNPMKRAFSAYFHYMSQGFIPVLPLAVGIEKIINNDEKYNKMYGRAKEIVEFGFYCKHLLRYYDLFDSDRFLIFLHDDIIENKEECIRKCYSFLGGDDKFSPIALDTVPKKTYYSLSRMKLIRLRNPFIYDYNLERTRLYPKSSVSLGGKLIVRAINLADRILTNSILKKNSMATNDLVADMLCQTYIDDINKLEKLIGRDLLKWKEQKK